MDDVSRSWDALYREQEMSDARAVVDGIRSEEAYFLDVIKYYNKKLDWFHAIEEALDLS